MQLASKLRKTTICISHGAHHPAYENVIDQHLHWHIPRFETCYHFVEPRKKYTCTVTCDTNCIQENMQEFKLAADPFDS